jgi:hypothetical protein
VEAALEAEAAPDSLSRSLCSADWALDTGFEVKVELELEKLELAADDDALGCAADLCLFGGMMHFYEYRGLGCWCRAWACAV